MREKGIKRKGNRKEPIGQGQNMCECDCKRETKRKFFSWTSDAPTAC